MDDKLRQLKGSPARDAFKLWHKTLDRDLYAMDLDLVLISKTPPVIAAALDYKRHDDRIRFTEVIGYNALTQAGIPVYLVYADEPFECLTVKRYTGGDWRPDPPITKLETVAENMNKAAYVKWERSIRWSVSRKVC